MKTSIVIIALAAIAAASALELEGYFSKESTYPSVDATPLDPTANSGEKKTKAL